MIIPISYFVHTLIILSVRFSLCSITNRKDSESCVKYLNGTVVDDRAIRVDHDWGFEEGRQWGRGRSGGQVRMDEQAEEPNRVINLF